MLHQMIFAAPKPGMSEEDFQNYWVHQHAVKYASKIPGIRRYAINTRIPRPIDTGVPLFSGCAEIWIDDIDALIKALQSPEFLQGARLDEPNWAAFWQTIGIVTETHELLSGPPFSRDAPLVKMIVLVKRKPGMSVIEFQRYSLDIHAPKVLKVPSLRRYHQCHIPEAFYATSEPPFDGAEILWFDHVATLESALALPEFTNGVAADAPNFLEPKYLHTMIAEEHWIIGPE